MSSSLPPHRTSLLRCIASGSGCGAAVFGDNFVVLSAGGGRFAKRRRAGGSARGQRHRRQQYNWRSVLCPASGWYKPASCPPCPRTLVTWPCSCALQLFALVTLRDVAFAARGRCGDASRSSGGSGRGGGHQGRLTRQVCQRCTGVRRRQHTGLQSSMHGGAELDGVPCAHACARATERDSLSHTQHPAQQHPLPLISLPSSLPSSLISCREASSRAAAARRGTGGSKAPVCGGSTTIFGRRASVYGVSAAVYGVNAPCSLVPLCAGADAGCGAEHNLTCRKCGSTDMKFRKRHQICLLYTSDAADDM
eukprot:1903715-Rhodomonas_salina.2